MYLFESVVRYSEIDVNKKMTLPAILDILQDCCTFHSEDLNVGIQYLAEQHRAWVLSSWQVVIRRYPKMGEKIKAYTWPYEFKGFFGSRNFKIENDQGDLIAYANSLWVFLDTDSGRPARIPKELSEVYHLDPPYEMKHAQRKIQVEQDMEQREPVKVCRFHIDTNRHMNNSKYVLLAEEYLPEDFTVGELRVEYKKAAVLSDVIYPKVKKDTGRVLVSLENESGQIYAAVEFMEDSDEIRGKTKADSN